MFEKVTIQRRKTAAKVLFFFLIGGTVACFVPPLTTQAQSPEVLTAQVQKPQEPSVQTVSFIGQASDPAAVALWKKTLYAQETVPLQARAIITLPANGYRPAQQQILDVFEGTGGKYRLVYHEPALIAGRILVSDGKTIYQYEPAKRTALTRPRPPFRDPLLEPTGGAFSARRAVLLPETSAIEGRSAAILGIRSRYDGGLREKRWVERQTGRSLRVEQYSVGGKLLRRVEFQQIVLPYTPMANLFQPKFPSDVRVIDAKAEHIAEAAQEALRQGLPARAGGLKVRSVIRPQSAGKSAYQFIFSDGVHALSVFVSPGPQGSKMTTENGWKSVPLKDNLTGYAFDSDTMGRSTVAWIQNNRRYVAVARLPMPLMLTMVRGLTEAD